MIHYPIPDDGSRLLVAAEAYPLGEYGHRLALRLRALGLQDAPEDSEHLGAAIDAFLAPILANLIHMGVDPSIAAQWGDEICIRSGEVQADLDFFAPAEEGNVVLLPAGKAYVSGGVE